MLYHKVLLPYSWEVKDGVVLVINSLITVLSVIPKLCSDFPPVRSHYKLLPDRFPTVVQFSVLLFPPGAFVLWIIMTNWVHWNRCYCVSFSFPPPAALNWTSPMLTTEFLAQKIPFSLLKMHSSCAWTSFWSQPCYYNSVTLFQFISWGNGCHFYQRYLLFLSLISLAILHNCSFISKVPVLSEAIRSARSTFKYPL